MTNMFGGLGRTVAVGLAVAAIVCPVCVFGVRSGAAQGAAVTAVMAPSRQSVESPGRASTQATDTATVRLHISGMTCGTCPVTARVALKKITGVYSATVTLDDSLGVVRFDPRQLTDAKIASELKRMTGFSAHVVADNVKSRQRNTT